MPKRKSLTDSAEDAPPRRSTRQRTSAALTAQPAPPVPASSSSSSSAEAAKAKKGSRSKTPAKPSKATGVDATIKEEQDVAPTITKKTPAKAAAKAKSDADADTDTANGTNEGRQYWLMKAEPETRYENGVDVSFSIDDLAGKQKPEPWDGIRNYVARNNLRAMKKGDLAFFSHSNCKEPGIVGTMEIVREHEPDLSAHNPKSAYYDAKSTADAPKWSVVHVEFRRKFAAPVTLKEMRTHAGPGRPLADMQMMKQSRLSVSRVSGAEWAFLTGLADAKKD